MNRIPSTVKTMALAVALALPATSAFSASMNDIVTTREDQDIYQQYGRDSVYAMQTRQPAQTATHASSDSGVGKFFAGVGAAGASAWHKVTSAFEPGSHSHTVVTQEPRLYGRAGGYVGTDQVALLERAGPGKPGSGSITGVFSVLLDGEDSNEPVADTVRGILDGHIVLDRAIADQGRYPAVNPLTSISRLAPLAWSKEEAELVRRLRTIIARYEETRDLRAVGAYKAEADFELDQAVALTPLLYRFLTQMPDDPPCPGVFTELASVLAELRNGGRPAGEATGTQVATRPS